MSDHEAKPWLVVVTGWTGAGKSTMADLIAAELDATVASFDWVMSGLYTPLDDPKVVLDAVDRPADNLRRVTQELLGRLGQPGSNR